MQTVRVTATKDHPVQSKNRWR